MDIQKEINEARKARDKDRLTVLQQIKTSIENAKLRKGSMNAELSSAEVTDVIRSLVARFSSAFEFYDKPETQDKLVILKKEVEILETYLPKGLTDEELNVAVDAAIIKLGGTLTKKEMGAAIKIVKEYANGRASGEQIAAAVKSRIQ